MQIQNLFGKNLNKYFRTNYKETYKTHFYLVCDGQFAQCILITSFQGLRALQKALKHIKKKSGKQISSQVQ